MSLIDGTASKFKSSLVSAWTTVLFYYLDFGCLYWNSVSRTRCLMMFESRLVLVVAGTRRSRIFSRLDHSTRDCSSVLYY